jgi:hypothetical protein
LLLAMTIIARAQNNQSPSEPLVEPMRINSRSGLQTTSARRPGRKSSA